MSLDAAAWSAFVHDPRDPVHASLRASDADRLTTQQLLAEAYAEGRLDLAEHDERAERAAAARLLGDLAPLLEDLVPRLTPPQGRDLARATPAELQALAVQEWRADRRQALLGFLGPTLICWTVYAAISWGESPADWQFPWPLIVTVVTLLNLLRVQLSRAELVADRLAALERKRAKALAKAQKPPRTQPQDVVRRLNERFRPPGPS